MDFRRALSQTIKHRRGGRTQKDTAAAAGIDESSWSQYENARKFPKTSSLHKIAVGLGCSVEELYLDLVERYARELRTHLASEVRERPATFFLDDGFDRLREAAVWAESETPLLHGQAREHLEIGLRNIRMAFELLVRGRRP